MIRSAVGSLLALWLAAAPLAAQAAPQGPPPCARPEFRQFDFWIGTWDVFNPRGQQVGTNTIDAVLGGCALHEQWQSAGPHAGFSYNIYDRSRARWHQTWVDNGGLLLVLEGKLENGRMVLEGTNRRADGREVLNRVTWTPLAPDTVRQLWETSTDQGSSWAVVFDGRYVRRR